MPKHRRHVLFRSFIESHINPEKHDEIKRAKTVIEGNVQKILQALGDDKNDGKEQVVNLVEDFHKHYQSLYERYDNLTEELRKKADGKHGKDSSLSRSGSSESAWEYQTALGEMQEAQNTKRELNSEAEKWKDEKSRLLTENARVETELELAKREIARLSTMLKVGEEERSKLTWRISQLEDVIERGDNKIQCPVTQSVELSEKNDEIVQKQATDKLEIAAEVITGLSEMLEQKTSLSSKISQLEDEIKQAKNTIQILVTESGQFREKLEEKERELSNQMELESLVGQKRESEIQLEKEIETLKQETLLKQFNSLEWELNSTHDQILELEKHLNCIRPELCESVNQAETSRKELEKRTVEHPEVPEGTLWENEVQFDTIGNNEKLQEVESSKKQMELVQSEKSQLETQVERSKQESEDLKREISTLSDNLRRAEFVQQATSQKLEVAVELLIYKQEEQKVVEDTLKGMMLAYDEARVQVSAEVDDMMTEIDAFYVECEERFGLLKSRVNEISNKIKMRKASNALRSNI